MIFIPRGIKMINIGSFLWIESLKIQNLTDIWQFFCHEAVETDQFYFFEFLLIKLNCPDLLNMLLPFFKLGGQF